MLSSDTAAEFDGECDSDVDAESDFEIKLDAVVDADDEDVMEAVDDTVSDSSALGDTVVDGETDTLSDAVVEDDPETETLPVDEELAALELDLSVEGLALLDAVPLAEAEEVLETDLETVADPLRDEDAVPVGLWVVCDVAECDEDADSLLDPESELETADDCDSLGEGDGDPDTEEDAVSVTS